MYYPVLLNIEGESVVVIGGGAVALRKIRDLVEVGAKIKVISPEVIEDVELFAERYSKNIVLKLRKYKKGDLKNSRIVFCATNDSEINKKVFKEAEELNIFCNSVDDVDNSSFILPSVMRKKNLIVSISTSGTSPAMSAKLKNDINKIIPDDISIQLDCLSSIRKILKSDVKFSSFSHTERGKILKEIVSNKKLIKKAIKAYKNKSLIDFLSGFLK